MNPSISPEDQFRINQVAATMAIPGMPLNEEAYNNLIEIAQGKKR